MTDRDKLPVKVTTGNVVVPAEQSGSLVTRGLEAVKNRQNTLLSVSLEADAGKSFRDAVDAYKRGDFAEAVNWFRKAADQGHAVAQFSLGVVYKKGRGVEKNEREAVAWFRKAAEQGDTAAQSDLGAMYRDGRGVEKNAREAVAWFRKAADQGYAPRNAISERCTWTAVALRRMSARRSRGIARLLIRAMLPRNSKSAFVTRSAVALSRTSARRSSGFARQPSKAMPPRNPKSAFATRSAMALRRMSARRSRGIARRLSR